MPVSNERVCSPSVAVNECVVTLYLHVYDQTQRFRDWGVPRSPSPSLRSTPQFLPLRPISIVICSKQVAG